MLSVPFMIPYPATAMVSSPHINDLLGSIDPKDRLDFLTLLFKSLPVEEKQKFLNREFPGFTICLGNSTTTADIAIQIYNASDVDIPEILEALVANYKRKI